MWEGVNLATTITVTELTRNLSDILNRVFYRGEEFMITRKGEPVATLAAPPRAKTAGEILDKIGHLKMPGDGFADDLEEIQRAQPKWDPAKWRSS